MSVDFGKVETFEGAVADKAQALKVIEEAAELFGAWQIWHENGGEEFGYVELLDEAAAAWNARAES